jgi:Holliday junction resolvase-like predicted endonuclease
MNKNRELGFWGEQQAQQYLEEKEQYAPIAKNIQDKNGEVDLVMQDKQGELIFLEVKTRQCQITGDLDGIQEELSQSLNNQKIIKILKTSKQWMQDNDIKRPSRIEFVIILKLLVPSQDPKIIIRHIKSTDI